MGTDVVLLLEADGARADRALAAARAEIDRLERVLSRFRPASELSRLNRAGAMRVGPDLARVLLRALAARAASGGRFDPTVHAAVRAAGYADALPAPGDPIPGGAGGAPCGGAVAIDACTREVLMGPGVALDLGGIAKGDAADRAVEILAAAGPALAAVGGDLAVSGPRADGAAWAVGTGAGPTIALRRGGVATSGVDRRRWRGPEGWRHHVIDPATGRPARTDLMRVTAVGDDAVAAEVRATDLLLRGATAARRHADRLGVPCVLVPALGAPVAAGGLR
ncbi:MAG TPA: FAD:protein FMN transferase [Miltoncostaeaceae bacterium]|nr:FAD:protein FMN transferase [Miltoncostaeaceae bacterium]